MIWLQTEKKNKRQPENTKEPVRAAVRHFFLAIFNCHKNWRLGASKHTHTHTVVGARRDQKDKAKPHMSRLWRSWHVPSWHLIKTYPALHLKRLVEAAYCRGCVQRCYTHYQRKDIKADGQWVWLTEPGMAATIYVQPRNNQPFEV